MLGSPPAKEIFKFAKKFYDKLNTKSKKLLKFTDGTRTGRECGPYHHHGYEGTEEKVANEIAKWINEKWKYFLQLILRIKNV